MASGTDDQTHPSLGRPTSGRGGKAINSPFIDNQNLEQKERESGRLLQEWF